MAERIDSRKAIEEILFVVSNVFYRDSIKHPKNRPCVSMVADRNLTGRSDTTGFDVAVSVGEGFVVARRHERNEFCACKMDMSEYINGYICLEAINGEDVPVQFDHLVFHHLDEFNNDHPVLQDADLHTCIRLACTMAFELALDEFITQLTEDAAAEAEKEDAEERRDAH